MVLPGRIITLFFLDPLLIFSRSLYCRVYTLWPWSSYCYSANNLSKPHIFVWTTMCDTEAAHPYCLMVRFLDLEFQASIGNFKLNGKRWPLKVSSRDHLESSVGIIPSSFLLFAFQFWMCWFKNQSFCHSRSDHTFPTGEKVRAWEKMTFLLEIMVTNAYQGMFVWLRIKVIIYNRSLAFCFPSKPRLLAQAPLRNNTRWLRLLDSVSINLPYWQWESIYLFRKKKEKERNLSYARRINATKWIQLKTMELLSTVMN